MPPPDDARPTAPTAEEQRRRRRRLAEIFGDVLPAQTSDDLDPSSDEGESARNDEWLRRQVPPHHG